MIGCPLTVVRRGRRRGSWSSVIGWFGCWIKLYRCSAAGLTTESGLWKLVLNMSAVMVKQCYSEKENRERAC